MLLTLPIIFPFCIFIIFKSFRAYIDDSSQKFPIISRSFEIFSFPKNVIVLQTFIWQLLLIIFYVYIFNSWGHSSVPIIPRCNQKTNDHALTCRFLCQNFVFSGIGCSFFHLFCTLSSYLGILLTRFCLVSSVDILNKTIKFMHRYR